MRICHCQSIDEQFRASARKFSHVGSRASSAHIEALKERSVASVQNLVDILDASEATVRRDINGLGDAGQIRRIRGGAEALTPRHEIALGRHALRAQSRGAWAGKSVPSPKLPRQLSRTGTASSSTAARPPTAWWSSRQEEPGYPHQFAAHRDAADGEQRHRVTLPGGTIYREQNIVLQPL